MRVATAEMAPITMPIIAPVSRPELEEEEEEEDVEAPGEGEFVLVAAEETPTSVRPVFVARENRFVDEAATAPPAAVVPASASTIPLVVPQP
jgi:hypothetical protein